MTAELRKRLPALLGTLAALAACDAPPPAAAGGACRTQSDCRAGLACVKGACSEDLDALGDLGMGPPMPPAAGDGGSEAGVDGGVPPQDAGGPGPEDAGTPPEAGMDAGVEPPGEDAGSSPDGG